MTRSVFFSFHYKNDYWRTQQIRQMGALQGQRVCTPNEWEEVRRKGPAAVERWIDDNMKGISCVVVLVGSETASRPWVIREIRKGLDAGKGVLGIRIDKLLDDYGNPSQPGPNPFANMDYRGEKVSNYAELINPAGLSSKVAYAHIQANMEDWIEQAIRKRRV